MERDAFLHCSTGPECGAALDLDQARMVLVRAGKPVFCSLCHVAHELESRAQARLGHLERNTWGEDE
jgi:hypothetical protein